jgi:hypothetical protein
MTCSNVVADKKDGCHNRIRALMKQISEVEEKTYTSSLKSCPEACCGNNFPVHPNPEPIFLNV